MTAHPSGSVLARKSSTRQRSPALDAPLTSQEGRLVGHLLGRREATEAIAEALGLPLGEVEALCGRLLTLGLLKMNEVRGKPLYTVH